MDFFHQNQQLILIQLLVKLGIMASLTALLARSQVFKRVLFIERRAFRQKVLFCLFWATPLIIGMVIRKRVEYPAFDISLEGLFVAGLLGGNVIGALTGGLIGVTAALQKEWLLFPLAPIAGMIAGLLRNLCPNKEEIWRFSPFVPFNLLLSLKSRAQFVRMGWQSIFLVVWVACDLLRIALGSSFAATIDKGWIFYVHWESPLDLVSIVIANIVCVGLAFKILNTTRLEIKLAEQEVLVVKARLDALSHQINPHFLFNTLNSISSLIRTNPESARNMIIKLSHILRRLLKGHDIFIPLREELEFIDNYLDIEVIRFGRDKLRIEKEVEGEALKAFLPGMLLQPIIENCIKHGIAPKIEGGSIRIRARRHRDRLLIDIDDDGMGIPRERLTEIYRSGIGISNVMDRLKVAYQSDFTFQINSNPGYGTYIRLEIPFAHAPLESVRQSGGF
jgi:two-component system, LytTR family, sensor kinase